MKTNNIIIDFEPPAPIPRTTIPSIFEVIKATLTNSLEIWGQPSYTLPWIKTKFLNERMMIINDPDFIHYILVKNAKNYRMATVRQLILRPILPDGLLTAEGEIWRRSRKSVAPVFTPHHAKGFADLMHNRATTYVAKYDGVSETDLAVDMTELTYEILAETLFSNDIISDKADLAGDVEKLLHTMGRVDPLDLLKVPKWVPR